MSRRAGKKTNYEQLQEDAARGDMLVRRWSPGDGITRYRFFDKKEVARVTKGRKDTHQSYDGPANGVCTALGLRAAVKFLQSGTCPRGRGR